MTGTVREYLYAGGEAPTAMRARQSDGTFKQFFFVTNTHGDVVAVTDRDGNIVNRYAYGPWGEATRVSEQAYQPFRYAGYRYEDGFDLYYLRARWLDPNTGRFLSRDPMAGALQNVVALNLYIYGHDSPASRVDPSGYGPRRTTVIAYLHGFSGCHGKPQGSIDEWVRELEKEFPNSEVFAPDYKIGWCDAVSPIQLGPDQIKRISEDFRSHAGGRTLYALGHSWGGVAIFRASDAAFVRVAITMGSPIAEREGSVGWWVAFCGDRDGICDIGRLIYARAAGVGPDELLVPGGVGHSDYRGRDDVKKDIYDRFRRFGAQ